MHIYAGYSNPTYATTWAEKDGNKYYGGAGVWAISTTTKNEETGEDTYVYENKCDSSYSYYTISANNVWDAIGKDGNGNEYAPRQELFKIKNARNNITFRVYWSPDNSKTDTVGDVNYNLAAYINSMLSDAEGNADFIAAAKALYAYSYVSEFYSNTK